MGEDLVVEHHRSESSHTVMFRGRGPGLPIVYSVSSHAGIDCALVRFGVGRDWYWVRRDGTPTVISGPWLGWLLDLAREHGWEG